MRTSMRSCREAFWAAPLLLAFLLAGCVGRNVLVFPWSQTPESRLEHVTAANFDERVLKCEKPVLVDFYAEWCGPCKKLGSVLEDFAQEHPEIRVVKVNVDENSDLVGRYGVKAMPTLLVIRGGKVTSQSTGLVPKEKLAEMTAQSAGEIAERPSSASQR
ncbi:MAG: thioredoxin [Thermoguttaceae bacterium]